MAPNFNWKEFTEAPNFLSTAIKLSLIVFFLVVIYFQDFSQVVKLALGNAEIQYILVVPLVACFFFYTKRRAFLFQNKNNKLPDIIGISICLLALLFYIYGSYSLYPIELHLLTLPLFTVGLIQILFGTDTLKALAFPIGILLFASPLPLIFSDKYGGALITTSTTLSANFLKLFFPLTYTTQPIALINTTTMTGQPITFQIASACSGIHSLIAMTFFAAIFLYIASGSWLKKILLAAISLIAAFLLNLLRIVLTVTIGYTIGYGAALDFFHNSAGLILLLSGVLLTLLIGDKILKLSFLKQITPNCAHTHRNLTFCYRCGKIFAFPKNPLNWKRISAIAIFALILLALFLQAAATTYNRASENKDNYITLDLNTGNTTAFTGIPGWTPQYLGRETTAENRLGLNYIGDYALTNQNGSQVSVILEVSDVQSKFHTWEGCLSYQSTPLTITRTAVLTLCNQNNTIVIAESMTADVPEYSQKLNLLYWVDAANLKLNNSVSPWALKITLFRFTDTSEATQAAANLVALGTELANSWTQYKNPELGFAVEIYQNITPAFIMVGGLLTLSTVALIVNGVYRSKQASKKTAQLLLTDQQIMDLITTNKPHEESQWQQIDLNDKLKLLIHEGLITAKYILINNQPYIRLKQINRKR